MKSVAIVAAHFAPSTLAGVHRARLWSLHLHEFGWEPIIVTTKPSYYEEPSEDALSALVRDGLQIIRTNAIPIGPLRIVGDVGIRGFYAHLQALKSLARQKKIDFCHITIPSNFSAPLGRLLRRSTGMLYGIDYIDPWVHDFPGSSIVGSKAWFSKTLASLLEPWCVQKASLITGINYEYFRGVLERNPKVRENAILAAMPYGGAESDHIYVRNHPTNAHLFDKYRGNFNMIYAGAMLPAAFPVLRRILEGVAALKNLAPEVISRLKVHFVGTGKSPGDPQGYNVLPLARELQVEDIVCEHPHRIGYIEVLNHLEQCSAVLVMGSTQPHYSPSKCYQSILCCKPVLTFLHQNSTAVPLMRSVNRGPVLTLTESQLPSIDQVSRAILDTMQQGPKLYDPPTRELVEPFSARQSACRLAEALDLAVAKKHNSFS